MDPAPRLTSGWASRSLRAPAAFAPDRARLDPRSFADLLAEAAELAGWVAFPNGDGTPDGDWRRILAADPAMVLALVAGLDLEGRTEGLRSMIDRAAASNDPDETEWMLERLLHGLLRFAEELDLWLAPAEQASGLGGAAFHALIEDAIESVLAPRLRRLLAGLRRAQEAGLLRRALPRFEERLRRRWALDLAEAEAAVLRDLLDEGWLDRLVDRVADLADTFVRQIRELGVHAEATLEASLDSGRHPPHVALVMAFARVFAHEQDRLNAIPQRIIRFVHEEVLHETPLDARPDQLLLAFVPRGDSRPLLEKGLLISAGKDESGAPIRFATDRDLAVTGARLAGLRLWTPVRTSGGAIAEVRTYAFEAGPDGLVGDAAAGIALLPAPTPIAPAWLIAGDALALAGGTRRISLRLAVTGATEPLPPDALQAGLRISVSTAQGWLDLGTAGIPAAWRSAAGEIGLTIVLPPDLPPMAPCPRTTLDAPATAALRLSVDPSAAASAGLSWALLSSLALAEIGLDIAVKDLPGLIVATSDGPASAAGAAAFGRAPLPGKAMAIGHRELKGPPLDRMLLHFDWASVPADTDGFAGYYRDYLIGADRFVHDRSPFTNAAFQVTLSAPVGGWDPAWRLPLFASAEAAGGLPSTPPPDIFAADFSSPPVPGDGRIAGSSWFAAWKQDESATASDGLVTLTLAGPEQGFGDGLYLANLHYAVTLQAAGETPPGHAGPFKRSLRKIKAKLQAAAKALGKAVKAVLGATLKVAKAILGFPARIIGKLEFTEEPEEETSAEPEAAPAESPPALAVLGDPAIFLPNPPFAPLVSAIRLDYARSVPLSRLDCFHASPFEGLSRIAPLAATPLLPPLPTEITIDLGLVGARPGLVHNLLVRTAGPATECVGKPTEFHYRAGTGWRKLPAGSILSDSSGGLSASGILQLTLPADAALFEGVASLRAILVGASIAPMLIALTADAVSATRRLAPGTSRLAPVAPGTIGRLSGIAGIARAIQPLASAGGRPAEDPSDLGTRLAERARHRGRAQLPWDIERIVLSEFPDIAKVKTVFAADPALARPTGEVLVVAVPAQALAGGVVAHLPAALRDSIETRLKASASPFARIRLIDPTYVPVDVSGQLRLDGGDPDLLAGLVAARLSPQNDPGFELDEDPDEIRAILVALLLRCPEVAGIERLIVTLRGGADGPWRLPVPGTIDLAGRASGGKLPW